jgi:hypothetical protein
MINLFKQNLEIGFLLLENNSNFILDKNFD